MMHSKQNRSGIVDVPDASGYISIKQNSIISLTKLVVVLSVLLALLMVVSK